VDAEARFRALFVETYAALRRYARHRGFSPTDSDDLVAEVFTIAWRRIDDVPEDATPWLFGVARNVSRNLRRGELRAARMLARLPRPEIQHPVEPDESADSEVIRNALASLDERDRELLVLVAWDGLTPQQAATALGSTAGATRVRLHRARARFAAALTNGELTAVVETPRVERTGIHRERVRGEVPDVCT
jgi:RNA polymerase sigma factor (sigma-70 family)